MSDLAGLSVEDLVGELATLASHLAAGMCRWLELVAEVERRDFWTGVSGETCAGFIAWRCGISPRAAREHVRVARRLGELPEIHAAFARGALSYAKVRALTRVADPESETELLQLASVHTASQLERAVRAYRRVTTAQAERLHERAHLDAYWDDDGSLVVRGRLAPEDGALFERALEAARDQLMAERDNGSAEPQPYPSKAAALAAVAEASLASVRPRRPAERYQVVVHIDADALAHDDGACVLEDGAAIAPETARRLACDASVVHIRQSRGRPLSVGRKTREVPPALRRALNARDRRCRFPGCENKRFVDAHHIRHWAKGGETSLDNLVLLCSHHHRLVHEGGYGVDENLRFYDAWGRRIPAVHPPPPGSAEGLFEGNRSLEIDEKTLRNGTGDRMDLCLTVSAFVQATRTREARARAPAVTP